MQSLKSCHQATNYYSIINRNIYNKQKRLFPSKYKRMYNSPERNIRPEKFLASQQKIAPHAFKILHKQCNFLFFLKKKKPEIFFILDNLK